jgi:uncharacterized membrane protein HdeD (DUF308 family)
MRTRRDEPYAFLLGHGVEQITRNWWLLLLRGLASILFGILALAWPRTTILALTFLFGAFALTDGIFSLVAAITGSDRAAPAWWLALVGVLGIAAGLVAFFWPGKTAFALVVMIGVWAVAIGILEILGAIWLRNEIEDEWWLVAAGILSVLFGLSVLMVPTAGALAIVWVLAAYAILAGLLMVAFAFRMRGVHRNTGGAANQ